MTLGSLFEKQVFIRLSDDRSAFICTAKWPLFAGIGRVEVGETGGDFVLPDTEAGSIAQSEALMREDACVNALIPKGTRTNVLRWGA